MHVIALTLCEPALASYLSRFERASARAAATTTTTQWCVSSSLTSSHCRLRAVLRLRSAPVRALSQTRVTSTHTQRVAVSARTPAPQPFAHTTMAYAARVYMHNACTHVAHTRSRAACIWMMSAVSDVWNFSPTYGNVRALSIVFRARILHALSAAATST